MSVEGFWMAESDFSSDFYVFTCWFSSETSIIDLETQSTSDLFCPGDEDILLWQFEHKSCLEFKNFTSFSRIFPCLLFLLSIWILASRNYIAFCSNYSFFELSKFYNDLVFCCSDPNYSCAFLNKSFNFFNICLFSYNTLFYTPYSILTCTYSDIIYDCFSFK